MQIDIIKKPLNEDDSYLINLKSFSLSIKVENPYLDLKRKKFADLDITKNGFEPFLEQRGSLRFFNSIDKLYGSIYTYSVQERNGLSYQEIINNVKKMLDKNPKTRRALVRVANSFVDYKKAEDSAFDVSCLSLIHYKERSITLTFRSSDIEYELFNDIITIYEFFILPVYGNKPIDIEIFGSTAQRVDYFDILIAKLQGLK